MQAVSCHQAAAASGQSVRNLPVSLFGSVMSIAGLSLAWRLAGTQYRSSPIVSQALGMLALLLFAVLAVAYLAKSLRYPEVVKSEFSHPVMGSFFGTVGISILLLSSIVGTYGNDLRLLVWTIGTVLTLALSAVMISRLLNGNAAPESIMPAWLIAGVGSLDVVVTGNALGAQWTHELNVFAAAIGGVSAIVFFMLIFSRMVHQEPLSAAMRPSKMILVAPFGVGFIAYVNLVQKVDLFAGLLFYFGLFLFAIISYRLLRKPVAFSASWWGIGFPMAALTNASLLYSDAVGGTLLKAIAVILLVLLSASVAVLSVRTVHALASGRLLKA